jgi:hypothetical protein
MDELDRDECVMREVVKDEYELNMNFYEPNAIATMSFRCVAFPSSFGQSYHQNHKASLLISFIPYNTKHRSLSALRNRV